MNSPVFMPAGLTRVEYFAAHTAIQNIKTQVLAGRPSGRVIDSALDEILQLSGGN